MLVIPAIDLKDGKCVRLRQGMMEDSTVFSDDPVDMAMQWANMGARRLHLVDLNGAFDGKPCNSDIVKEIAQVLPDLPIQIGGGIRNTETIDAYLSAGVQYVIIGTKAVSNPDFIHQICDEFPKHIILGVDAKDGMVATDGWAQVSKIPALDLAQTFKKLQAIVYTDISRDGMMQGVNIKATKKLANALNTPIIASGGITNMGDIKALCAVSRSGIMGAITGRAIYEGQLDLREAQEYCDNLVTQSC